MRLFTTRRKRDYSPLAGGYGPTVFKRVKHTGDGVSPRTALQGKRAAAGAVGVPPRKKGRGLHNPFLTLRTRHELWEDAVREVARGKKKRSPKYIIEVYYAADKSKTEQQLSAATYGPAKVAFDGGGGYTPGWVFHVPTALE